MFGDRFSSSTSCSRWLHETEPDRPDQSLTCCFLKVATHPHKLLILTTLRFQMLLDSRAYVQTELSLSNSETLS